MPRLRRLVHSVSSRLQWLPPTVARLTIGVVFVQTGWGKLHSLPKVIGFFQELGIPAPQLQAPLVATVEFVCGGLILIGLFTRVATLPLIVTMTVAIATAKRGDIHGLFDLVGFDEFTYLCILLIIAILGPGTVSFDELAVRRLGVFKAEPHP